MTRSRSPRFPPHGRNRLPGFGRFLSQTRRHGACRPRGHGL